MARPAAHSLRSARRDPQNVEIGILKFFSPPRAPGLRVQPLSVKLSSRVTSFVTSVTGFVTPYRVEDEMLSKRSMVNTQHSNNQTNETLRLRNTPFLRSPFSILRFAGTG